MILKNINDFRRILKNKSFMFLWIGQMISTIGDEFFFIALTLLVIKSTGKPSSVSILYIFMLIPTIVLGPISGVFADKWNKKRIIIYCDLARGIFCFVGIFILKWIIATYILVLIMKIFSCMFLPALRSSMIKIVDKDDILISNSLYSFSDNICRLVGPILGGLILSLTSNNYGLIFMINGISFIIATVFSVFINLKSKSDEDSINFEVQGNSYLFDLKEGIKYIKENSIIKFIILFFAIASISLGALSTLNVIIVDTVLHLSPEQYGFIMACFSAGLIASPLIIGFFNQKVDEVKVMVLGIGIYGLSYIGFTFGKIFILSAIFFFICGLVSSCIDISYSTYLQKTVDEDKQGRVFSVDIAIGNFVSLVSMATIGIITELIGISITLITFSLFLVLESMFVFYFVLYKNKISLSK